MPSYKTLLSGTLVLFVLTSAVTPLAWSNPQPLVLDNSIFEGRTPRSEPPHKWLEPSPHERSKPSNGGYDATEIHEDALWNPEFRKFASEYGAKVSGVARLGHLCDSGRHCRDGFETFGSGALIGEGGKHILTAAHIFWPAERPEPYDIKNFRVKFDAMNGYEAVVREIYAFLVHSDDDLILVELSEPVLDRATLNLRLQDNDARRAFTIGYPSDLDEMTDDDRWGAVKFGDLVLAPGSLQRVEHNPSPSRRGDILRHTVLNTAWLARGNSGSPLLDVETGEVVGIHVCWYRGGYNLAVRTSYWDEFAENVKPVKALTVRPAEICGKSVLHDAVETARGYFSNSN